MISNEEIYNLANSISEKFNTHKLFLFGSFANGSPTMYSDLDICVITDYCVNIRYPYPMDFK